MNKTKFITPRPSPRPLLVDRDGLVMRRRSQATSLKLKHAVERCCVLPRVILLLLCVLNSRARISRVSLSKRVETLSVYRWAGWHWSVSVSGYTSRVTRCSTLTLSVCLLERLPQRQPPFRRRRPPPSSRRPRLPHPRPRHHRHRHCSLLTSLPSTAGHFSWWPPEVVSLLSVSSVAAARALKASASLVSYVHVYWLVNIVLCVRVYLRQWRNKRLISYLQRPLDIIPHESLYLSGCRYCDCRRFCILWT